MELSMKVLVLLIFYPALLSLPIEATILHRCQHADIVFVLDESESLKDEDPFDQPDYTWNLIKGFVKGMISTLAIESVYGSRVAVVKYASAASVMWNLNDNLASDQLLQAVDILQCDGGNTNTADGLRKANEMLNNQARNYVQKVIVIFTDGLSSVDSRSIEGMRNRTVSNGIIIYVIAIGKYVDDIELKIIAGRQHFGKYLIYVPDYTNLPDFIEVLQYQICRVPTVNRTTPLQSCARRMDLALMIDSSGSITDQNYESLKLFLSRLVAQFEIGPDHIQVGAIRYSDNATIEFGIGDYNSKTELNYKITGLKYENGNTNTSGAIRMAVEELFTKENGDRPDAENAILLVTDGSTTLETNGTLPESAKAKARGIEFYALGITTQVNTFELHQMVSKPIREHYYESTDVAYLDAVSINLMRFLCDNNNYVVS